MLMIPDRGVFFEFVPLEERRQAEPPRVPLWGVERASLYAIVVTTPSGLYAYKLGDIVRFPSHAPCAWSSRGACQGCLSTTQELTTHVEIERAVEHAKAVPCVTFDFGCGADVGVSGSKSRYVLFVEFVPGQRAEGSRAFGAAFDAGLCEQNRVYREHRSGDIAILAPGGHALPRARAALHEGRRDDQRPDQVPAHRRRRAKGHPALVLRVGRTTRASEGSWRAVPTAYEAKQAAIGRQGRPTRG
jgi:hypothetical protein